MKFQILKEDSSRLIIKIFEESLTYPLLLKDYCLKNGANFVGHYKEHPNSKEIILVIEGKNPKEILEKARLNIIEDFKKLKENIKTLKISEN